MKFLNSFSENGSVKIHNGSGAIQVLRNAVEGGRMSDFPEKKCFEDVRFNVISVTRG